MLVFRLLAQFAKLAMVAIFLAASLVAPGRLDVSARIGANPHIAPGGRDSQVANAGKMTAIAQAPAGGSAIGEVFFNPLALEAETVALDIGQAGGFSGLAALGNSPPIGHGIDGVPPLRQTMSCPTAAAAYLRYLGLQSPVFGTLVLPLRVLLPTAYPLPWPYEGRAGGGIWHPPPAVPDAVPAG